MNSSPASSARACPFDRCPFLAAQSGHGHAQQPVIAALSVPSGGFNSPSSIPTLKTATTKIAASVIAMRAWPIKGTRHDFCLALGGSLARAGWGPNEIADFVQVVANHAGSDDPIARGKDALASAEAYARGEKAYGWPELRKHTGEAAARKLYRSPTHTARGHADKWHGSPSCAITPQLYPASCRCRRSNRFSSRASSSSWTRAAAV
jgi:hypothetical protein